MWTCIVDGVVPNELSILSYLVSGTLGTGIMILNYRLLMLLLQSFQVWFLIIMSVTFAVTFFSIFNDARLCVFPVLLFGLLFSITLDAYPGSGRFLAGVRFYSIKLSLSLSVILLMTISSRPEEYFETVVGEITFSGGAIILAAATNIFVFGLRNMYQLFREPECLVVLSCLVELSEDGDADMNVDVLG